MMNDRPQNGQAQAGLCGRCLHVRLVTSARGSQFFLCRLSATDARFPRYPPVPVLRCAGFAPREESLTNGSGSIGPSRDA